MDTVAVRIVDAHLLRTNRDAVRLRRLSGLDRRRVLNEARYSPTARRGAVVRVLFAVRLSRARPHGSLPCLDTLRDFYVCQRWARGGY